jgi:hypothetical protein
VKDDYIDSTIEKLIWYRTEALLQKIEWYHNCSSCSEAMECSLCNIVERSLENFGSSAGGAVLSTDA